MASLAAPDWQVSCSTATTPPVHNEASQKVVLRRLKRKVTFLPVEGGRMGPLLRAKLQQKRNRSDSTDCKFVS